MSAVELKNCPDCAAEPGSVHDAGCDVERCSVCKGQWISCGHDNHNPQESKWTGVWPGIVGCQDRGFYVIVTEKPHFAVPDIMVPHYGDPCSADHPDASEDLSRWSEFYRSGQDVLVDGTKLWMITSESGLVHFYRPGEETFVAEAQVVDGSVERVSVKSASPSPAMAYYNMLQERLNEERG